MRLRATSVSRQRKTKVVLGAMLGLAVRHNALAVNPVQQTSRIYRERSDPRSLTPADIRADREALRAWAVKERPGPRSSTDMPDIIDLMLATGARIGEILAVRWVDAETASQQLGHSSPAILVTLHLQPAIAADVARVGRPGRRRSRGWLEYWVNRW